ncbi:t-SNARE [Hesseltinella vesiculosa]|uniref:t-SNARE n=1 Tax=Hesseltinella vesiculosa TaxID=101127 RepID=A0A1X2GUM1_9FUNG|nr:t-SNARE [Hesseltinella vesiculosa]
MSGSRFTMSRDRLAELRGNSNEKRYDRLSDEEMPPMPSSRPRYDDDYAYHPPSNPPPSYTKTNHRKQDQYEMVERKAAPTDQLMSIDGFFTEVEEIKEMTRVIHTNISDIEELHGATLVNISEEQAAENNRRLDRLVQETAKLNNDTKNRIKAIELANARLPPSTGDLPMRKTQHAALKKKFIECIQRYQDIERTYQQKYRQRVERQIRIVQPDATPDEIDRVLDSEESSQIFTQSLMQANRSGQARAVLSEVQSRHNDIKKIERTILELHQLFMDMQMMLEHQQETITQIETHAEATAYDLEAGNKDVSRAIVSAKATRKKKWMCFFIFIIVIIVAAILIWWFALNHPGVH